MQVCARRLGSSAAPREQRPRISGPLDAAATSVEAGLWFSSLTAGLLRPAVPQYGEPTSRLPMRRQSSRGAVENSLKPIYVMMGNLSEVVVPWLELS
jgi:hypothetical protein